MKRESYIFRSKNYFLGRLVNVSGNNHGISWTDIAKTCMVEAWKPKV
jgi:hypothetical protein